jgi:hypothetical protein
MLKMAVNVAIFGAFLLMALVFGFFLWETLFSPEEHGGREAHSKPAYSEQHTGNENTLGGSSTPSPSKTTDEAIAEYTKWLAIFTLFLVMATLGLFVSGERGVDAARRSARAAQDAAEIANKSLIATNRAWVSVAVSIDGDLTWVSDGTVRLPLRFDLKNLGKVPADISIPIKSAVHLMFGPVDPIKAHEELCREPMFPFKGLFGITLFPDGTASEGNSEMIRVDEIEFFKKREGDKQFTPVVMGCIKYRFSLDDKTHTTPFIFHVARTDPNTDKLLGIVPDGTTVPKNRLLLVTTFSPGLAD